MDSGREGNLAASDPVANRGSVGIISSTFDEFQGEKLLEGSSLMALDLSHALPGATLRVSNSSTLSDDPLRLSPTPISSVKRTNPGPKVQLPETMLPLQSSEAGAVDLAKVDFKEVSSRGDQMRKSYPTMTRTDNSSLPAENAPALRRRSRLDNLEGRHKKSPFKSDMLESRMEPVVPAFAGFKKPNFATATEEKSPDRSRSTRRAKVSVVDVQDAGGMPNERRSSRSATRRARAEAQDVQEEGDLGMGDANRASRRTNARPQLRQIKRKVADPITTTMMPASLPERRSPPIQTPSYPPPAPAPAPSSSLAPRSASRDTNALESSDWLLFMLDIVMWRHVPRSALLFGMGCFGILSTSLMQGTEYSAISIFAYIALLYLAATFFKFTFLRGASSSAPWSPSRTITESDALKLVRVLLPPTNIILNALADLFSGEPIVTLKVAAALWLLAQAGHMMNLWTLSRVAYFALFTVPKVYSSYSDQIYAQARTLLRSAKCKWDSCSYKKAISFAAFGLAWNFFSVSTRIFGAFISVVALCVYQRGRRDEPSESGNFNIPHGSRPIRTHSAPAYGLQLMTLPQPNLR